MKDIFQRGFKFQLLISHLLVASMALLIVAAAVGIIFFLSARVKDLALHGIPIARSSTQIVGEVQRSLANLRGWLALKEDRFTTEWRDTWKNGIEPAMAQLLAHRPVAHRIEIERLLYELPPLLRKLKASQWWVQEVAHAPGNEPARMIQRFEIEPITHSIISLFTAIENEPALVRPRYTETLRHLHLAQRFFLEASLQLERFLGEGAARQQTEFQQNIAAATNNLQWAVSKPVPASAQIGEWLSHLMRELATYRRLGEKAIQVRRSERWNLAQYLLVTETIPIVDQIEARTAELNERASTMIRQMVGQALYATRIALAVMGLAVMGMIALVFLFARMRARALAQPVIALSRAAEDLAAGRLQADLPVTGTDEVGELTRAFNSMRHTVQQAQTDLREANRTLEKRVQERTAALQESEMRFRTMVETAPNGILIYDAEKDRFVEANTRSCELIGYPREELMQKSWTDISAASQPDGRTAEDKIKPLVEEALEGRPRYQEWVLVHSKGQEILVEMRLNPIFFAGRRLIRASLADITERRQLELQLQQALKLEAVGTLAGGIAHEFNNILSIILGNAELAKEFVNASTPVRANMEEIIAACLRGRDVVHGLLSFSRKSEHKKMAVDIVPIIKETLKLLRSSLPANIEIRQEISNQSCIIMADPTQIHQVMINLGTNAAHAMESGGTLTVGLRAETFEPGSILPHAKLNPGSYVHLWVHDTGRGIEPENLDRIFDPFFTTKDVSKGTGLGLAVVMGIVDNHKASIFVKSQPGQGTAFDVYFPAIESFTPEPVLRPQVLPGGKERILFIDDEKSIAEIAQVLLERLGYSVNSITDPLKALELFEKDPGSIDLVITDLSMPHVTGEQLAIRMLRRKPDLPIILVSGYSDRMNKQRAEELGIRLYIQKPLDRRKLAFAVRQILDQEHNPT